ncbi:hypothetical protein SASPL_126555 [Salvia splendens]|uniref:BSD2 cysteine rich domain-containing protein n=1 Tax=Salvia splendens TaxID=180675 RepID=A0A8X8XKQ2_SALSN|nr:hypothetical protein SASPL_126555 [Salvia splendens]
MALSLCSSTRMSFNTTPKTGTSLSLSLFVLLLFYRYQFASLISDRFTSGRVNWITDATNTSNNASFQPLKATPEDDKKTAPAKVASILCQDCEGNGAKQCGQCKGTGINSVDHFNGQYKAGASCWLCRGKREVLCGSCNGAGFLGGFLSSLED